MVSRWDPKVRPTRGSLERTARIILGKICHWCAGECTSLALDGTGRAHISYQEYYSKDLRYARALGPVPLILTAASDGTVLMLNWTSWMDAATYRIYGDVEPHFEPDHSFPFSNLMTVVSSGTTTWNSPNGICNPDQNWMYLVIAMDSSELALNASNRAGEFDFSLP